MAYYEVVYHIMLCYIMLQSPPLNKKPPNKKPPVGGNKYIVTIDLDGGTITPLIRTPPSDANIVTINLDGANILLLSI